MQDPRHDEPNPVQNLSGAAAVEKLRELGGSVGMFSTFSAAGGPCPTRPMATQRVDDDGTFSFFSAASSNKNRELAQNPLVQLYFANVMASEYLSVYGRATVTQDRALIREYWKPDVKIWFQDGPDDPDLTLILVKPEAAHYWDTKHNQFVALLKMGLSLATGRTLDDGVEGELRV